MIDKELPMVKGSHASESTKEKLRLANIGKKQTAARALCIECHKKEKK